MYEWDAKKNLENIEKHGVSFEQGTQAFDDPDRVLLKDEKHSGKESRYFCLGLVGGRVMTVRFTVREGKVRIFGAGYWRYWKDVYEKEKN